MKKILLTALSVTIFASGLSLVGAESKSPQSSNLSIESKQQESSAMRTKYYNEYKAKGYEMSSLEYYLDASKTSDGEYWAAFKIIKDKKEIPERRSYVEKLKNNEYDVSGFSEAVINDAGKFWEMVKIAEQGKKYTVEAKREEYKKVEPKKEEYKKEEMKNVEDKKTVTIVKNTSQTDRLKSMMKARIAKLPIDTRDPTLARLESTLMKAISIAKEKNAKLLIARYEVLLSVVREEMDNIDDDTLINGLFQ